MRVFKVDLYKEFNREKTDGAVGELVCYVRDNSIEINKDRKNPAMLVIPGGGYGMVSDREGEPIAIAYLNKGFNCFVLKYSVSPLRYPTQITEADMAMEYIKEHADEFMINENKISAVGFSAGGHLCAMLGTSSVVKNKPSAVVLSYPVITCSGATHIESFQHLCGEENADKFSDVDILNLVDQNSAPAFIWSTYEDGAVPVRNSILLADAYEKAGVKFSVHVWGKGQHGLSVADKTVYGRQVGAYYALENMTPSVKNWVDFSVEWLEELNLYIED